MVRVNRDAVHENRIYSFPCDSGWAEKMSALWCRYVQAELVHCRFAMVGTAGVLFPTALGLPQWYEAGQKAIAGVLLHACALLHFPFVCAQQHSLVA